MRAGQALPFSGVKLSRYDSIGGMGLVGPSIWFGAVQMPAGGETVSMKPMPAITGALIRKAKFTGSKSKAVSIALGLSEAQFGNPLFRPRCRENCRPLPHNFLP